MPITNEILFKHSTRSGTAGNTLAQADPNASLGKYISTTPWAGGVLHDLFDAVDGDRNANLTPDYRCIFVHNSHASLSLQNAVAWLDSEVAGGASVAIGVDPNAAVPIGSAPPQANAVLDQFTAPAGVVFTSPTGKPTGVSLGTIPAGQCRAVWIKRTPGGSAMNNDGVTIKVEGDTAA